MERLIQLDNLNRQEALRYLGSGGQTPDDAFMALMKDCEKTVLAQARRVCGRHGFYTARQFYKKAFKGL